MLKVLHGPVNVGNQPWVLSRYERACGLQSDLVVNYNTWFGYQADQVLTHLARRSVLDKLRRLCFAMSAPFRYDVFHYYFGLSFTSWNDYGLRTPLWFQDLKLARRLGLKVFMTLQGCDARLSARSADRNRYTPCTIGECAAAQNCREILDGQRKFLIEQVIPLVDKTFILNPELMHYVPGATFLPYASVDINALQPRYPDGRKPLRIVHAPSDPSLKGTKYIIEVMERLKKNYDIKFTLVQNVPHAEALKLYEQADLLIDQLLFGWYGGIAVELMALGKAVACYLREEDFGCLPREMIEALPIIRVTKDSLESVLERIIADPDQLRVLGHRSREFVERWHNPHRIAAAVVECYQNPKLSLRL